MDETQLSIFALVLTGHSSRRIANKLDIDLAEVERIIRKSCRQLGASSRMQAALIIANRQGWPTEQAARRRRAGPKNPHFEPRNAHIAANSARRGPQQFSNKSYVRDVEGRSFEKELFFGAFGRIRISRSILESFNGSYVLIRLLHIMLIIVGGALALSALISAMQGFENLIRS